MPMTRRTALKLLGSAGIGVAAGTFAYGFWYGREALQITRADLPVAGLPQALDGLRIGLLTDIHRSQWVSADDVARAVGLLMKESPDLIVLGGDYVTWGDRRYVEPAAEALAP